ncbi:hypothetical protein LTR50_003100 [Elasticomyces elasticus]|nr:hypothetical protein LTR50_003100 [Elasticomyces elasticus]
MANTSAAALYNYPHIPLAAASTGTPSTLTAPLSASSGRVSIGSNNTYVMSGSPVRHDKARKRGHESYRPRIITTVGQRPACLVNASVTYVGNDQIYAFGGFDQYTDEVYNHVLKLDLTARQWSLVDNYGDIPGVRMGHTANLWQGDKLLVYGGENEHRTHLSDVIIFDLKTAHWTQPEVSGPAPRGRARHSAVVYDEKLFICGGMAGSDNAVLDDICYLDLKTWMWSRTWSFLPRYDHSSWVWGGKIWVSGGLGREMERTNELWWLDFRGYPAFDSSPTYGTDDRQWVASQYSEFASNQPPRQTTGYPANSSSLHTTPMGHAVLRGPPVAPGAISSLKFMSSPNMPTQNVGTHFHVFSSGCLLDFVTPASMMPFETSLSALDLDTLRWQKLADGRDLFEPSYRWHYCCLNEDGTHAWLLGCPTEPSRTGVNPNGDEYLSDVLPINLNRLGLLGNRLTDESRSHQQETPSSDTYASSHLSAIGADLARTFNQPPETGSGADFIITAEREVAEDDDDYTSTSSHVGLPEKPANTSPPIHVHRFILSARWPHFSRLYNAQMSEFHSRKMHIPEPYSAVRAFLYYLYTDSIAPAPPSLSSAPSSFRPQHSHAHNAPIERIEHPNGPRGPTIEDVAGMLVMSNIYDMPRLRHLCVNRLLNDLDVQHAALVFDRASTAGEEWLKRRAASFCLTYWGRVVRTEGFRRLRKQAMVELCEEVDSEGRVVGGDELEAVGALGGGRIGGGLWVREGRKRGRVGSAGEDAEEEGEGEGEEGMELS